MTANIVNNSNTPLSEKNEWRTPPEVFAWASRIIGVFDYDTACTSLNALAPPIWATTWKPITPAFGDALSIEWSGVCFCNPPYDDTPAWIDKAIKSEAITALFIPSPNGEACYERLIPRSHEIHIVGRVGFIAGASYTIKGKDGKPDKHIKAGQVVSGNTRGSSLFIINGYGQGSRSFVERDYIYTKFARGLAA